MNYSEYVQLRLAERNAEKGVEQPKRTGAETDAGQPDNRRNGDYWRPKRR